MRRVFVASTLLLLLSSVDASAQNLLREFGNAIKREVGTEVKDKVNNAKNEMREAMEPLSQKRDEAVAKVVHKTNTAKQKAVRLDKTKYYTQEEADIYYPPYHPVTIDYNPLFLASIPVSLDEAPLSFWLSSKIMGGSDERAMGINKIVMTVNDVTSNKAIFLSMPNIHELWLGREVDAAKIYGSLTEVISTYEFNSKGGLSREFTIFLPADKYPKGLLSIQEEIKRRGIHGSWTSGIPLQALRFKTMLYTGDIHEAAEKGASAAKHYCPGHSYTAKITAAYTMMRQPTCQQNTKFYYSCKYCGECEHNTKHTFELDQFNNTKTNKLPHTYVMFDLSDKHYVGRNSRGEKVYRLSCYWCGTNNRDAELNYTQADLVRDFGADCEMTLAQFKEMKRQSWANTYDVDALENVYVGGFDYPGYFAVPDDDHGAQVSPSAQNDTRWAMIYGLIDKELLGSNYLQSATTLQVASLAVRLAEGLVGKEISSASGSDNAYICKALAAGIIAEEYNPNAIATRQQMATYMFRALQYVKANTHIRYTTYTPNLEQYKDNSQIVDWAYEAMGFMNALGLVKGTTKTTIEPLKSCTIEEAVIVAKKAFRADELGWYQAIRPNERGYAGSPGGAYDPLGITKLIQSQPIYGGEITLLSYYNCDRIWVSENWIGHGLQPISQRDVLLPFVDKYTGATLFVDGEEFLPIKEL